MKCPRCTGLMMQDSFLDLQDEAGLCRFVAWRCMICGEVLDPVILKNRMTRPTPILDRARRQLHQHASTRTMNGSDYSGELGNECVGAVSLLAATEREEIALWRY